MVFLDYSQCRAGVETAAQRHHISSSNPHECVHTDLVRVLSSALGESTSTTGRER